MASKASLTLFPEQKEHVKRLLRIAKGLDKEKNTDGVKNGNNVFMDLSMLGTGKTYTSCALAKKLRKRGMCKNGIIVVCNVSVMKKWESMKTVYGVPILQVVSYASLRSRKGTAQPDHGLLQRKDWTVETRTKSGAILKQDFVEFGATDKYRDLVHGGRGGVFVVFDEVQNIKNTGSDQWSACCALLREVWKSEKSRAVLMSGSPIDKAEQCVAIIRALGIMGDHTALCTYDIQTRMHDFGGMQAVTRWCDERSPKKLRYFYTDKKSCIEIAYRLFQNIIKPVLSSAMIGKKAEIGGGVGGDGVGTAGTVVLEKYNGMFKVPEDVAFRLGDAVEYLARAARYNAATEGINVSQRQNMAGITAALVEIERIKTSMFVRLADAALVENPKRKVVVCLNYLETIANVRDALYIWEPLVMTGANTAQERQDIIEKFQEPNGKHRLLIGNLSVLSTGIDLDDKHGGWERVCYVSPMFSTITLYQLGHRFQRMDTHASARARLYMVYAQGQPEVNILNALQRKGQILKDTVKEQAEAGVVFPCDYPVFVEN